MLHQMPRASLAGCPERPPCSIRCLGCGNIGHPATPGEHRPPPRPIGQTLDLKPEITRAWKERVQQIFPAEAVALVITTWSLYRQLRDCDVTWFIDNEAAAAAGIRGASKEPDVTTIVQAAHLLWMSLGTRVWIEWIDTASNPSDGLSRAGLLDPWTQAQDWQLSVCRDPPWSSDVANSPDELYHALWRNIGQREG